MDGKLRAGCKTAIGPRTEMTDQSPPTPFLSLRAKVTVFQALGQALCAHYNHTSKLLNNKIHFTGEGTKALRGK